MATPVGDDTGDLISSLNNDLLVRILDLLPDTRDAVRTHALARRWRGLWTGVAALRFDYKYSAPEVCRDAAAPERYLAFVNDVLALRAKATRRHYAVKELAIWFDLSRQRQEPILPSYKSTQGWIRYAAQNEVKSLVLEMDLPWHCTEHLVMAIDDLTTSAKLETLHLRLGYAQLELFSSTASTVVFASLTDLSLRDINVAAGLLSVLVSSSCCPRLRKLHLSRLVFSAMEELLFESGTLLELSMGMGMTYEVRSLELRAPSLRVLHFDDMDLERFKISSAPRLDDLMFLVQRHLHIEDVHGDLSRVATLKIELSSHSDIYNQVNNDGSFDILKRCRLTRSLEVSLYVVKTKHRTGDMIKGRIPPLLHVTSLTLDVTLREPHFFGSGIASFLAQCSSIRYLRLQLCYHIKKDLLKHDLLCEDLCQWKSHEFSLAHLQEIEFKNLIGTDCELQFLRSILKREKGVQKVAISFDRDYWINDNKDAFNLLPTLDGGSWTTCNNAGLFFKWRKHCV